MRIGFTGRLEDQAEIRAGFIGCGSHSFRNIYPVLQFAPVRLVCTCDLDAERAAAFARQFGAERFYTSHHEMLGAEDLDAVFIVTGYGPDGRPLYPSLAVDCLEAGRHVWIEKPPASTCADIERMQTAARHDSLNVLVAFKKMFMPSNEKARELMELESFGATGMVSLQYPQSIPEVSSFREYFDERKQVGSVIGFLDHLCHPMSLLVYLMGMPETLYYKRNPHSGSGSALFGFPSGAVASMNFTSGQSINQGLERTLIVGQHGQHITVDNNLTVTLHRNADVGYGNNPSFYTGGPDQASAVWTPEFSLGQLYNKGMFLQGFYGEVFEFATAILENRPIAKGTLEQAWQVTRIFEAFAEGPDTNIVL